VPKLLIFFNLSINTNADVYNKFVKNEYIVAIKHLRELETNKNVIDPIDWFNIIDWALNRSLPRTIYRYLEIESKQYDICCYDWVVDGKCWNQNIYPEWHKSDNKDRFKNQCPLF